MCSRCEGWHLSAGVGEFFDLVREVVVKVVELGAGDLVDLETFDSFA